MSNTTPIIDQINEMSEEELKQMKKKAVRNVATLIAFKVGIAVVVHYASNALINKLNEKEEVTEED